MKGFSSEYWTRSVERYWHGGIDSPNTRILKILLKENLAYFRPRKILEVGCGPGIFTQSLCERARTVAIDLSCHTLKFVKKRGLDAEFVRADMDGGLPFKAKSFDMIVAYRVVEYSRSDKDVLKQFSQLAPVILLQLPRHDSINGLALFFRRWIGILLKMNVRFKSYSLKGAVRLAKATGLSVLRLTACNKGLDIHMTLSATEA